MISYLYLLFLAFFLDEFYLRWLKIWINQDRDEPSNSYFDSVLLNHLKWNLPKFININCCEPAQCCQALAQRIICIFHYFDFFFFLTMSIHSLSVIPWCPSLGPSSSVLLEHFSFMISSIRNWLRRRIMKLDSFLPLCSFYIYFQVLNFSSLVK